MCTYQQLNAIYIYAGQNHYHFCFSELFVGHAYKIKNDLNIAEKNDILLFIYIFEIPIAKTTVLLSVCLSFLLTVCLSICHCYPFVVRLFLREVLHILLLYIYTSKLKRSNRDCVAQTL